MAQLQALLENKKNDRVILKFAEPFLLEICKNQLQQVQEKSLVHDVHINMTSHPGYDIELLKLNFQFHICSIMMVYLYGDQSAVATFKNEVQHLQEDLIAVNWHISTSSSLWESINNGDIAKLYPPNQSRKFYFTYLHIWRRNFPETKQHTNYLWYEDKS